MVYIKNTHTLSIGQLKNIVAKVYNWAKNNLKFLDYGYFKIDFNEDKSFEVYKQIKDYRLPNLKYFVLRINTKNENEVIHILNKVIPIETFMFVFDIHGTHKK